MNSVKLVNELKCRVGFTDEEYRYLYYNGDWAPYMRQIIKFVYEDHDDIESERIMNVIQQMKTSLVVYRTMYAM
jgi:hypothetical protein